MYTIVKIEIDIAHSLLTEKLGLVVMFVCLWMSITGIVYNFNSDDPAAFGIMVVMCAIFVPIGLAIFTKRREMKVVLDRQAMDKNNA